MPVIDTDHIGALIERTLNHVDMRLIHHGRRVAFLVKKMLEQQQIYRAVQIQEICFLALLHDIGAYKTEEIDQMVQFETINIWEHSIYGYLFIKYLSPLQQWAPAILLHHQNFDQMDADAECGDLAQIINIADRVDVFMENGNTPEQLKAFLEVSKGSRFDPKLVDLFFEIEKMFPIKSLRDAAQKESLFSAVSLPQQTVNTFLNMLIYTIDFRSYNTVTHTITTTAVSVGTADLMGLDSHTQEHIGYGALLHDLGKIAIPVEILEFAGKLSPQAMQAMRTHVDLTEKILGGFVDPVTAQIALRHHEKLDGSGYPKGLTAEDLTLSQRIVAVADIVSALCGTRSYKTAYPKEKAIAIITKMAIDGLIDPDVVAVITKHFDQIMEQVQKKCQPVVDSYERIHTEYKTLLKQYSHGSANVKSTAQHA